MVIATLLTYSQYSHGLHSSSCLQCSVIKLCRNCQVGALTGVLKCTYLTDAHRCRGKHIPHPRSAIPRCNAQITDQAEDGRPRHWLCWVSMEPHGHALCRSCRCTGRWGGPERVCSPGCSSLHQSQCSHLPSLSVHTALQKHTLTVRRASTHESGATVKINDRYT